MLTHGHPVALEEAAAGAIMVALALVGTDPEQIYHQVAGMCGDTSPDFTECWNKIPDLLSEPPEIAFSKAGLGEGWVAEEAVASAMYCFWRSPDDFTTGVLMAVNTDGDSDSIGTIAGSLLGARLGIERVPQTWRCAVENSEYLHDMGRRLWAGRVTPG